MQDESFVKQGGSHDYESGQFFFFIKNVKI